MKRILAIALILTGCTAQAQPQAPAAPPAPSASPTTITSSQGQSQGRFKLKITLNSIEDLKVKRGDVIVAGQIVADRVRDRTRLQFQKESLEREIKRLKELQLLPIPEIKPLPNASFRAQAAEIEKQRHKAEMAARSLEQQQRKLDVIKSLPATEIPEAVVPHEELVLGERQRESNQAQAEVQLAQGKLDEAQEAQRTKEYAHSLETSKRAIALKEQELKQQATVADLEARLSQVEVSLSQLSAVRSPYGGKIQTVKVDSQADQNISVELTLIVNDGGKLGEVPRSPERPSSDRGSSSPPSENTGGSREGTRGSTSTDQ
jgi:hypothetical protein